jgi:hypothetical protein
VWIFFIFDPVRFVSGKLASSSNFFVPGAASPPANIIAPPRHVMLPSHGAKMSSLHPLHLLTTFHPITSSLEPKPKK